MPSDVPADAPRPRLCHLVKWSDFDGYGFNLHAEKAKLGQFIGKVDEGSPAESAGMREGDRIIEVNGVNVGNENHKQVVERIKAIPNETKLLVIDSEADKYYKSKKMVVKSSMSNVVYQKTAATRPSTNGKLHENNHHDDAHHRDGSLGDSEADERRSQASSITSDRESLNHDGDKISRNGSNLSTPPIGRGEDGTRSSSSASPDVGSSPPLTPTGEVAFLQRSVSAEGGTTPKGLNLNMTASEMRARLADRKKYDPRKESLDLRKKHAIIQDM